MAVHDDLLWNHATNAKIVDIAADLLGTDDIKMYGDQYFMKSPRTGSAQPWHQDSASWRDIFPMDLVTAWTAIDDSTLENGCLHFVPGTHRCSLNYIATFDEQRQGHCRCRSPRGQGPDQARKGRVRHEEGPR